MALCGCDMQQFLINEDYGSYKEVQLQGVDLLEVLNVPNANGAVTRSTVQKIL